MRGETFTVLCQYLLRNRGTVGVHFHPQYTLMYHLVLIIRPQGNYVHLFEGQAVTRFHMCIVKVQYQETVCVGPNTKKVLCNLIKLISSILHIKTEKLKIRKFNTIF